jgi:viroplasmin and RNaseH domain-containing protein
LTTKFVSRLDLSESRVDRDSNVIRGVSLVSLGEARGHNKIADKTTLQQVRDCAQKYKNGLRVRFNPTTFNHGDAGLAGYIPSKTIEVKDDKVVGDLHVYSSYPSKDYLYEIAERAPDNFGLSIEFNGVPEEIGGQNFARCDEIFAATVVDLPAANPTGLFASKNDKQEATVMTDEQVKTLSNAIVEGLKPLFAFRQQSTGSPTDNEKAAAGCVEGDSDDVVTNKITAWRAKADQPVTRKDLLELFRFTGGKPAKASGEVSAEEKTIANGEGGFESLVTKYRVTGMSASKAVARAREDDREGYNAWCQKGRPDISSKKDK